MLCRVWWDRMTLKVLAKAVRKITDKMFGWGWGEVGWGQYWFESTRRWSKNWKSLILVSVIAIMIKTRKQSNWHKFLSSQTCSQWSYLIIVVPQSPAELVIIHVGLVLAQPPQPGHLLSIHQLELTTIPWSPGDDVAIALFSQQLQQKLPQRHRGVHRWGSAHAIPGVPGGQMAQSQEAVDTWQDSSKQDDSFLDILPLPLSPDPIGIP